MKVAHARRSPRGWTALPIQAKVTTGSKSSKRHGYAGGSATSAAASKRGQRANSRAGGSRDYSLGSRPQYLAVN
jgi:hypothetical protein